jgi:pimeloyl-ACP methyl ester carboxylesterase
MQLTLNNARVNVYTGGRALDASRPAVVLVHGAGLDHSVWNFQARHLAQRGFAVIAPDLPGHGRSEGPLLASIEAMADWLLQVLAELPYTQFSLVGHSMGSLIGVATAQRAGDKLTRLVLVGSTMPMPVAEPLQNAAWHDRPKAHAMINQWSYTTANQLGRSVTPGTWMTGVNRQIMSLQQDGVLATDLQACNAYQGGLDAAATLRCPTLLVCGEEDRMTPPRSQAALRGALANTGPQGAQRVVLPATGHAIMAEAPAALNRTLVQFLSV